MKSAIKKLTARLLDKSRGVFYGKVRFGIMGVENQGTYYTGLFQQGLIKNGVLTAVADINSAKKENIVAKYPEMQLACFENYKEMLDSGMCDAVLVETPHYDHAELAQINGELVAVCDIDESRLTPYSQAKQYTSYARMLSEIEVDVVHICTPHLQRTVAKRISLWKLR